jgi:hypothetical protein
LLRGLCFASIVGSLVSTIPAAEGPRLAAPSLDASGHPLLVLSGLTNGPWRIEASTNFLHWFSLAEGSPSNGEFRFLHQDAPNFKTLFYRGAFQPTTPAIQVVPQADTNVFAVRVFTPEAGGTLALTNASGVRYSFSVGPSNLTEAVMVAMKLITNFTAFPSASPQAAVLFEPDGFVFPGAGLLTITYPTNIPPARVTSYAFGGDGADFHLKPDLVSSNEVRIPVTHFSGVGTGLWALLERTFASQQFIQDTAARIQQQMATQLADAREQGRGDSADVGQILDSGTRELYDTAIKPFLEQAKRDCSMAQTLTPLILGIERQRELMGLGGVPSSNFLASNDYKAWTCNCLDEALRACKEGRITAKTLLQTVLDMERGAQLLGMGDDVVKSCGLGSIYTMLADPTALPCAPDWIGTAAYSESGTETKTIPDTGTVRTHTMDMTFSGEVEETKLVEDYPWLDSNFNIIQHQRWQLTLSGPASGSFNSHQVTERKLTPCGKSTDDITDQGGGNNPMKMMADFTFDGPELKTFTIGNAGTNSVKFSMPWKHVTTFSYEDCVPKKNSSVITTSGPGGNIFLHPRAPSIKTIVFTRKTPLVLEGSVTETKGSGYDGIPTTFTWTFSLHRKGS